VRSPPKAKLGPERLLLLDVHIHFCHTLYHSRFIRVIRRRSAVRDVSPSPSTPTHTPLRSEHTTRSATIPPPRSAFILLIHFNSPFNNFHILKTNLDHQPGSNHHQDLTRMGCGKTHHSCSSNSKVEREHALPVRPSIRPSRSSLFQPDT